MDSLERVLSAFVPAPTDTLYQAASSRVSGKMTAEGDAANFTASELNHKRGQGFAAINAGLSYGNGHTKPTWLSNEREEMVDNLLADKDIQRLAAYQDGKSITSSPA
jgi:hypothetical protein